MPMDPIPVIDLFAGPGGMSEGFSSLRDENGEPVFRSIMSIEMERTAHATLRLRAFARRLMDADGRLPQDYIDYLGTPSSENLERLKDSHPEEWAAAEAEAIQGTLKEGDDEFVEMAKKRLQGYDGPLVLIGGPPCQAYSLVGRARRTHDKDRLEKDVKQTLYKCYLRFIEVLRPTAFVMENVKGLLSARNYGEGVFGHIRADMEALGYELHSMVVKDPERPHDFIVRADEFGVPQARHRVILFGTRSGCGQGAPGVMTPRPVITVDQVLGEMPRIRSGFSSRVHDKLDWKEYVRKAAEKLMLTPEGSALGPSLEPVMEGKHLPSAQHADGIGAEDRNPFQRHLAGEFLDSCRLGMVNHFLGRTLLQDCTFVHENDAIGYVFGESNFMCHDNHRDTGSRDLGNGVIDRKPLPEYATPFGEFMTASARGATRFSVLLRDRAFPI